MVTTLIISGPRQTGKSTLLAHYIKDAQAAGLRVLLTGPFIIMLKQLEHNHNFKADATVTSTVTLLGQRNTYDVLAIDESTHIGRDKDYYLALYGKYLKDNARIAVVK